MINKILPLSALLVLAAVAGFAQTGQIVIPLSNPGNPYTLDVKLLYGSIRIAGYNGKEVIIDPQVRSTENSGAVRKDSMAGMKRPAKSEHLDLTTSEHNNVVSVNSFSPGQVIDLTLKIPQQVKLKLSTVNGNITTDKINGELEVNSVSGAIKLTNISGSVVATTLNNTVTVTFIAVDPQSPMAMTSFTGNVDITLPSAVKNKLKLKTDHGELYSDFEIKMEKSPQMEKPDQTSLHAVKTNDWIYGKINGGGPEIMVKTTQGNIYIRKAR